MCFSAPKVPKPPPPIQPPTRASAEDEADKLRKRKSVQDNYSNWALATGPSGVKDFAKAAQVPSLSSGTGVNLGTGY